MASGASAAPRVVISQAYGAGGQNALFPNADYVELVNAGDQPQDLAGWSLQVSQGSDTAPWTVIPLAGVVEPGQHFLVRVSTVGGIGVPLPTPDVAGNGAVSLLFSTDGRAALVTSTTPLINTPCPTANPANLADFVVWGTQYTCAEGTQGPATGVSTAIFRAQSGCLDSNNNAADFATAAPMPRNSTSNIFLDTRATPNNPLQGGSVVILASRSLPASVPCVANFGAVTSAVADLTSIGGPAAFVLDDDGGDDDLPGDGLFGATFTLPETLPTGVYSVPVTLTDGTLTLTEHVAITVRPGIPANDTCAGAINLGPLQSPFTATVDNSTAGADANPVCGGSASAFFGVWYRFDAPATGLLRLRETGAQDVVFGVYPSADCGMLTPGLLCSATDDPTSVSVSAGSTYHILVGAAGAAAPTAPLDLNFSFIPRPVNDDCAAAIELGSLAAPFSATVDNAAATDDIDVTCNSANMTRFGVWYTFTPASSGVLLVNETGAQDAVFGLFTGECGSLVAAACQSSDNNALITNLVAGTRYHLLLGNQGSSTIPPTAPFVVTLTFAPNPANDACGDAREITTFPFFDSPYAPVATADVDVACNAPANTTTRFGVWYRFTTSIDSGRLVLGESTTNDVVFALFDGAACDALGSQTCAGEAAAAAGVRLAAGASYRLLVGLNSATALPTLPYLLSFNFTPDVGACCTPEGCIVVSASACTSQNGVFRGVDTACTEVPRYVNATMLTIPDYTGGPAATPQTSTIVVPAADAGNISTSLAVRVALNHAAGGDLTIRLTGPDNTTVNLLGRAGVAAPCALNGIGTLNDLAGVYIFSDAAAQTLAAALVAGPSPLPSGAYRPSGCADAPASLNAAFVGRPAAGTWTLTLIDESAGITGSLQNWGLIIDGFETPCPSGGCCLDMACTTTSAAQCARIGGTFESGVACGPQSCAPATGACCRGSTCVVAAAAECTGLVTQFAGPGTVCNVFGVNNNAPCCLADYNHDGAVTVQDIFEFLFGYFNAQPAANINNDGGVTLQDIFDYLFLYLQGQCN
jgi:hypothetical protein